MCADPTPVGAWDQNITIAVNIHGHAEEPIDYRTLFAALALAEAGPDRDPAARALEENVLPDGMGLGLASFGIVFPEHRVRLDTERLELAAHLAQRLLGEE